MRCPSIVSSALAARLLFLIQLTTRSSSATNTTNVQSGDTFLAIADNAGIPVESLEAANPGVIATQLYSGQVITVPATNGPATGMPAPDQASSGAPDATPTTLATSARPAVSSNPLPNDSSSMTPLVSASGSSMVAPPPSSTQAPSTISPPTSTSLPSTVQASSPTSESESSTATSPTSTTSLPTSTSLSSTVPVSSSTSESESSTAASPTSTTVSSTTTGATSASSSMPPSTTSSSASPSTHPVTSTTPPPPPPSTMPNSPPAPASCNPTPSGKYHDDDGVHGKVSTFCASFSTSALGAIQTGGGVVNGDDQPNKNHGSTDNEAGYNLTVTAITGCSIPNADIFFPYGNDQFNCTQILYDTYSDCNNNEGMGGSITAGCFVYMFDPDP